MRINEPYFVSILSLKNTLTTMNLPLKQEAIPYDHNNDLEIFKKNSALIEFEQLTRFIASF